MAQEEYPVGRLLRSTPVVYRQIEKRRVLLVAICHSEILQQKNVNKFLGPVALH